MTTPANAQSESAPAAWKVGCALVSLGAIEAVVAMWWWALFGMAHEIGTAHIFTSIMLGIVGMSALFWAVDR